MSHGIVVFSPLASTTVRCSYESQYVYTAQMERKGKCNRLHGRQLCARTYGGDKISWHGRIQAADPGEGGSCVHANAPRLDRTAPHRTITTTVRLCDMYSSHDTLEPKEVNNQLEWEVVRNCLSYS